MKALYTKKLTAAIVAAAIVTAVLPSCGEPSSNSQGTESAASDETLAVSAESEKAVTAADIAAVFDTMLINAEKLSAVDDDFVVGMLEIDTSSVAEYVLKIQTAGTEVDQYGIFRVSDKAQVEELEDSIEAYLEKLRSSWDNFNYLPEEMPKIKAAEIRTSGPYVVFVVMSESEKAAVFKEFSSLVK